MTTMVTIDEAVAPARVSVEAPPGGPRSVRIAGDLCYSTVELLPPAAELLGHRPGPVVVDLRGVLFMDLAGWRWLAAAVSSARSLPVELEIRASPALLRLLGFVRRAIAAPADDETAWLAEHLGRQAGASPPQIA
jgi:hypothetical protein